LCGQVELLPQQDPASCDQSYQVKRRLAKIDANRMNLWRGNNADQPQQTTRDKNAMKEKQNPLDNCDLLIETRLFRRVGDGLRIDVKAIVGSFGEAHGLIFSTVV
jgi:hypothetical protein